MYNTGQLHSVVTDLVSRASLNELEALGKYIRSAERKIEKRIEKKGGGKVKPEKPNARGEAPVRVGDVVDTLRKLSTVSPRVLEASSIGTEDLEVLRKIILPLSKGAARMNGVSASPSGG